MDIPFPSTAPRFVDSKWFSADNPCDEEAELIALEQSNKQWFKYISLQLSSIGQQYKGRPPLGKAEPEPMEECNDESEDSEESHDEDEEEDLQPTYAPRNQNEQVPAVDLTDSSEPNTSDQSTLWP